MPKRKNPRHGSMQFWPRKKAKRIYPRIRAWTSNRQGLLGFAGYKAGMTHAIIIDHRPHSQTKGEEIQVPLTVIECPPLRILSARFYKTDDFALKVVKELAFKADKEVSRKIPLAKKPAEPKELDKLAPEEYRDITVCVYTQPKLTNIKKTPEIFEMHIGGSPNEKLQFIKEHLGKDITVDSVLKLGQYLDLHAVTKGKGTQGPVKRFGIGLKNHKTEKGRRTPGSLGGWKGQGHFMYRVAHAGQTGFHQRVQYSNKIIGLEQDFGKVNPKGGFLNYGQIKNPCVLIRGSVPGPKKRLILLTEPLRPTEAPTTPEITYLSTASKQGK